jgi:hypothetical protein
VFRSKGRTSSDLTSRWKVITGLKGDYHSPTALPISYYKSVLKSSAAKAAAAAGSDEMRL